MTQCAGAVEDPMYHAEEATVIYHTPTIDVISSGLKMDSKAFSVMNATFNALMLGGTHSKPAVIDAVCMLVANNV